MANEKEKPLVRMWALASAQLSRTEAWLKVRKEEQESYGVDPTRTKIIIDLEGELKTWTEMIALFDLMEIARKEIEPIFRKHRAIPKEASAAKTGERSNES